MSFSDFIGDKQNQARSSIAALQSLREQIEVKLAEYSETINSSSVRKFTFEVYNEILDKAVLCQLTSQQIRQCMDETVENVDAVYDTAGNTISLTRDRVNELFEEQSQELQIQREFLASCLENETVEASSWVTNMLTKYPSMSASFVENFSQHFKTGDKIQALQSWCRTFKAKSVTNESTFISVTSREEYGGSDAKVFSIMLSDFTDAIDTAFSKCWQGLQDLYGFFQRLWIGIKNLGIWLAKKAFRGLLSNFEKSESNFGYMDFPLFQLDIGVLELTPGVYDSHVVNIKSGIQSSWEGLIDLVQQGKLNFKADSDSGYYRASATAPAGPTSGDTILRNMIEYLVYKVTVWDAEINDYVFRPIDIVWSGPEWNPNLNLLFRIGCVDLNNNNQYDIVLQIFYLCSSNLVDSLSDYELISNMALAFRTFVEQMGNDGGFPVIPIHSGSQYPAEDNAYYTWFHSTNLVMDTIPNQSGPINLSNYVKVLSYSDWNSWYPTPPEAVQPRDCLLWVIATTVLPYMLLMGPVQLYDSAGHLSTARKVIMFSSGYENDYVYNRDITLEQIYAFKPYSMNYPYGVSIHFQSMQDRASELERYLIILAITAAATYITFKLIKARKNIIAKAAYARGQADAFAWQNEAMTPERLQEWTKLNRVAKRYERLSAIFGAITRIAATQGTNALIENLSGKSVKEFTSVKQDNLAAVALLQDDINECLTLIDGVERN